ncbi:MAG: ComEC/Rec2 family competence protein, partial [Bacteroidales bacterium]|nr:ComEC/Rec2 family competence protein [Candidatus Latescibacterota bacterium]
LMRCVLVCITGLLITSSVTIAEDLADSGSGSIDEIGRGSSVPDRKVDGEGDIASSDLSVWLRDIPLKLNSLINSRIDSPLLTRDSNSILKALILADRKKLDPSIRDGFSYLGVAHYLALSGLHLGAIAGVLSWLMSLLPLKRIIRDAILLVCLTLYTLTAGSPHSLLRAIALLITMRLMFLAGKKITLPTALISSSFILVSFRYSLLSSPGFLLSFTAVAGIGYMGLPIMGVLTPYLPRKGAGRILSWLVGVICITVSVQMFTLPLILGFFGRTPVLAFISNILLGVPVMAILYMGLAFVVVPAIWMQSVISVPVNMIAWIFRKVPETAGFLGGPAVHAGDIEQIAYSLSIITACLSLGRGRRGKKPLLLLSVIILTVSVALGASTSKGTQRKSWPDDTERSGRFPEGIEILKDGTACLIIGQKLSRYHAWRLVTDLWKSGVSSVDIVIVQGTDMLSLMGISSLGRKMKVAHLICSPFLGINDSNFNSKIHSSFGKVTFLAADTMITVGESIIFLEAPPGLPSRGCKVDSKSAGLRLDIVSSPIGY